jgi:hypothetical protein
VRRDYLAVAKRAITHRKWRALLDGAYRTALDETAHPVAVAKARDFILKALLFEKSLNLQISGRLEGGLSIGMSEILSDPESRAQAEALAARVFAPALPLNGANGVAH